MRAGYTPALEKRLRRADPAAHPIVEIAAFTREAVKTTKANWQAADSTTGFSFSDDGTVRLSGTVATIAENTVSDSYTTDLRYPAASTLSAGAVQTDTIWIEWHAAVDPGTELRRVKIYLDPDRDGLGTDVDRWRIRVMHVVGITTDGLHFNLREMRSVTVDNAGSGEGYVTFDLSAAQPYRPASQRPAIFNNNGVPTNGTGTELPQTIIFVYPLSATGLVTGNAGLAYDSASMETVHNDVSIMSARLGIKDRGPLQNWYSYNTTNQKGAPRVTLETGTYTGGTLSFTNTPLDLGAVPSAGTTLELTLAAEEPGGSSIVAEISADGGSTWFEYRDGDRIGEDNTLRGGCDLSALPRQQIYETRYTFTPG